MQTSDHSQDWLLLRRYVEHNSQSAFAALVAHHLNLVYSTCWREVGDAECAQDATQAVFLILARKAPALRSGTHLAGWLFQTARFVARNMQTRERRRQHYEQQFAQKIVVTQSAQNDALWNCVEPFVNDAVARLPVKDREAILRRFWDEQSLAEVGAALGVSEEAARKRVGRALERLRQELGKQGILVPSVILTPLLTAHAVKAVPVSLAPVVVQRIADIRAGHASARLVSSSVHQLSEGALRAMKIAQVKTALFITATAVISLTTFAIARELASSGKHILLAGHSSTQNLPRRTQILAETSGKMLTSQQIVEHCQQAYDSLQSYQVMATVTSQEMPLSGASSQTGIQHTMANIQFVRPGKIRVEGKDISGNPFAFISDGTATALWMPGNGWQKAKDVKSVTAELSSIAQGIGDIPHILFDIHVVENPLSPFQTYNPEVQEGVINGYACYLVTATRVVRTISVTRSLWIDKKTFLLRQMVTDISGTAGGVTVKSHEDQVYTNEKRNISIPDNTFAMPAKQ